MHFFLLYEWANFFKNTITATKPDNTAHKFTLFQYLKFAGKCLGRPFVTLCEIIKQPAIFMMMS